MAASMNSTDFINALLDPKLFQVIGSTPQSLKDSVQKCDIKGNRDLGMRFVALSTFAAAVNKPTVEQFFMQESLGQLRTTVSSQFTLNNQINMTALSLAGHCFLAIDSFSSINFIRELRKKMGQNSIWDGEMASGSMSEKQKGILKEKAKQHKKEHAAEFANWFMDYTGLTPQSRPRPIPISPTASRTATRPQQASARLAAAVPPATPRSAAIDDLDADSPPPPDVADATDGVPEEVLALYLSKEGRTLQTWAEQVNLRGKDRMVARVQKALAGDGSEATVTTTA